MPATAPGSLTIPPGVAAWMDTVMYVFVGLVVLWIVLKAIGFALRRSYNLTPVATAPGKGVTPDFLTVDHDARKQMIDRGRAFDEQAKSSGLGKAMTAANVGVVLSGLLSFLSAAFLAFGRIKELDETWKDLSVGDRFVAIVQSHPIGFTIAFAMTIAALTRLVMTVRTAK